MSVFQKSIKVILVTWIAVQIATFLGLNYPSSAGIIGLLSLLDTRRSTLLTAKRRVLSMTSAMLAAILCFSLFGLNIWAF
ncbi:aromatic acid exporter family protein, partial [Streptococcus danieliae]|nr:aromatic acid exporter family protein [Streptococcus danieliae]